MTDLFTMANLGTATEKRTTFTFNLYTAATGEDASVAEAKARGR